jgi:hypothetical protein
LSSKQAGIGVKISVTNASELLDRIDVTDEATRYRILVAREVVDDIARLDETQSFQETDRRGSHGIGNVCDEHCWRWADRCSNDHWIHQECVPFSKRGHYATYNATAPIEVSSGGNTRHRLNLRGNRILNHAIHIAAVTQLRHDTNGRIYFDKKIGEGKTPKEAIRVLKRRISDAVYKALIADTRRTLTS